MQSIELMLIFTALALRRSQGCQHTGIKLRMEGARSKILSSDWLIVSVTAVNSVIGHAAWRHDGRAGAGRVGLNACPS